MDISTFRPLPEQGMLTVVCCITLGCDPSNEVNFFIHLFVSSIPKDVVSELDLTLDKVPRQDSLFMKKVKHDDIPVIKSMLHFKVPLHEVI